MTDSSIDLSYMPRNTKGIFDELAKHKFISGFTLIGGTALSVQIRHRLSEDLDFIFDGKMLNINTIKRNISAIFPEYKIIRQDNRWQIDFVISQVKVTFFSTGSVALPLTIKDHSFNYKKINICNAKTIASLKMATIAQRNTIRDYYDLYFLAKYIYPLKEIIEQTRILIPGLSPITYTGTLVYTDDIEEETMQNHLIPKEEISKYQIANFFVEELKKIKEQL